MVDKKKFKYMTKNIKFGKSTLTLYSLDGVTWSSRKDELAVILERHEQERQKLQSNMGEAKLEEEQGSDAQEKEKEEQSDGAVIMETSEEETDKETKRAGKQIKDVERKKAKSKAQVKFVTPKPRQLEKKRGKTQTGRSKKRAA